MQLLLLVPSNGIPFDKLQRTRCPMAKNTSITLGDHFNDFVSREVEIGRFGTASEVVRAGLRLLEVEEKKLEVLRRAIDEGDASPDAKGDAFARVRKKLKLKRRRG